MTSKQIAIYPGTFDPITLGHLDVIKRSSLIFGKLIIAVAANPSKTPLFSVEERKGMIKEELFYHGLKNVEVKLFDGLLVEFVKKEGAVIIVRGLRAVTDFEYEFQMSFINRTLDPSVETIFLPATEGVHFISSSFVKEITRLKGDTKNLVPQRVQEKLIAKFSHANK
ncbi:pantetheine-phosphate adenylyltransferase [Candidatus Bandiella euplotis]|uniref:Phosphopantetheine adenylyltransferase n=1 Tax=Candidatus Bandiella euplotis TaxID=1664265 RepID=A0ABZ0UM43_9RICK|nr:pantetheine-phosphate adenylyltransferase [Candidatus Bandiella woodruffii]WPX97209.1 Phosphopantetheine adenylyltransferase [Candidatus Bandiella woodruffii]